MSFKTTFLAILMIITIGAAAGCGKQTATNDSATSSTVASSTSSTIPDTAFDELQSSYDPQIATKDFTANITNKYFTLIPGTKMIYEGKVAEGTERTEIVITEEIKVVMGIGARVYWDRVYLNDELIEDTKDWFAQDSEGNVWYFGEAVDNYEDGKLKDHEGEWEAGVDGALPGIIMKAFPKVGDTYREEYYPGYAEDMADIISIEQEVTTKRATYKDCIKTANYTPLEPDVNENKYYCSDAGGTDAQGTKIGGLVLEEDPTTGEKAELISIETIPPDKSAP